MIIEANLEWQHKETETGLILPWYTLPCLEWLKKQNVLYWNVFEYGSGYSTIWWRAHCYYIKAVESVSSWAIAMGAEYFMGIHYVNAIEGQLYDCVIVDGDLRRECLIKGVDHVIPGGYIIIDNWGQDDFPEADVAFAEGLLAGWEKQLFKQPNHSKWVTAVFRKP